MKTVKALAVSAATRQLEPFEYELGELGPNDVDIAVQSCGICHSDISMIDNAWGISGYPLVPGHEIIGTVQSKGEQVTHLDLGDTVGLGWHAGYCMTCSACMHGQHNLCPTSQTTIRGRHGGFADTVRAHAASVIRIPKGLDAKEAGPLLCGGITMFNAMLQTRLMPTDSVAIIGIGGLGHLGLKLARAWGCEVTALTSQAKQAQALEMGAHRVVDSRDLDAIKGCARQFDVVLSTVNVRMHWNAILGTLKRNGRLHLPGAVTEPLDISVFPMMARNLSVGSSPVGPPHAIASLLEFSARHQILPVNEHFPLARANDAIEHLRGGKARYRVVLDCV